MFAEGITNGKGCGNPLAGLQGGPGIGVGGNLHADEARDDGGDGSHQEGDGGEDTVVQGRLAAIGPSGCREAILGAQQHKDDH